MTDRSRNLLLWWTTSWLTVVAAQAEPAYATPLAALCALAVVRAAWLTLAAADALRLRASARWRRRIERRRAARESGAALLAALADALPSDVEARAARTALRADRDLELVRGGEVVARLRPVAPADWSRSSALYGAARRRARPAVLVPAKSAYAPSELRLYLDEALERADVA